MELGVIELLEAGLELYRRSFRGELWRYGCATLPLLGALLVLWQRIHAVAAPELAGPALLLTGLFALHLLGAGAYNRRLLVLAGGEAPGRGLAAQCAELWNGGALLALAAVTAPLLAALPMLYAASQFAPLEGAGGLGRALRRAGRWWGASWAQFGLALLFGALLLINLAVIALLLPALGDILLGASGAMARASESGTLLASGMFWLSLAAAVYFALDPLYRCVMVVAYRKMGAAESAEDLLERLRRIEAPEAAERARA